MRAWPWILGGSVGAALAVYYWTQRAAAPGAVGDDSKHAGESDEARRRGDRLPGRWVWPLGVWRGRKPRISDGYQSKRRTQSGELITHGGVDVMYRRLASDPWRVGTPNSTVGFVMPERRAALAASDGVVSFAANTPRGWTVIIDHAPRKLATYYTHLSALLVHAKETVHAGTPIGVVGADPLDGEHIMHLHFEIWRGGAADRFDPQPLMLASWECLPDPGDQPGLVARNMRGAAGRAS